MHRSKNRRLCAKSGHSMVPMVRRPEIVGRCLVKVISDTGAPKSHIPLIPISLGLPEQRAYPANCRYAHGMCVSTDILLGAIHLELSRIVRTNWIKADNRPTIRDRD